jgi:hypothetical protein
MKLAGVTGIVLIIVGAIALIYGGVTYTSHKTLFKAGPVHASASTHKTIPLPPVLGIVLVAGGIVLVAVGSKSA